MGRTISAISDWVAVGLLAAVGLKMIWEALSRDSEIEKPRSHAFGVLVLTAIGTSIDALAVGVGLSLIKVAILPIAVAIGLATFGMTTAGILIGRMMGDRLGRVAEFLGGVGLIALGARVLYQHFAG